jgi:hypothetical protein
MTIGSNLATALLYLVQNVSEGALATARTYVEQAETRDMPNDRRRAFAIARTQAELKCPESHAALVVELAVQVQNPKLPSIHEGDVTIDIEDSAKSEAVEGLKTAARMILKEELAHAAALYDGAMQNQVALEEQVAVLQDDLARATTAAKSATS